MNKIMRLLLLVCAFHAAVGLAFADSLNSSYILDTTTIQDGRAPGSINPASFRAMTDSDAGLPLYRAPAQAVSFTPTLDMRGTKVLVNATSQVTVTLPLNSSVAYPVGTLLYFQVNGSGMVVIAATAPATVDYAVGFKPMSRATGSVIRAHLVSPDTWTIEGDLAAATAWYCDGALVTGSANGTSWANAWKTIAAIGWGSLGPGDVLYISGGTTSQTYNELLAVGAHTATAALPLVITAGVDPGHNGTVIIDGTGATTFGSSQSLISNGSSRTNFTLQNMTAQNTLEQVVRVTGVSSGVVRVQNLVIHTGTGQLAVTTNGSTAAANGVLHFASVPAGVAIGNAVSNTSTPASIVAPTYVTNTTGTTVTIAPVVSAPGVGASDVIQFGKSARGASLDSNTGGTVFFQNNSIDTPASSVAQTDGIYTQLNSGSADSVIARGNSVVINNTDPSGHSDGWQSYEDTNVTISGNFFSHPNGGANNHGFFLSDVLAGGTLKAFNNIISMAQVAGTIGVPDTAYFRFNSDAAASNRTGIIKLYNNVIYGSFFAAYTIAQGGGATAIPAGDEFKNNIVYPLPASNRLYDFETGNLGTPANTNYNDVFWPSTGNLRIGSPTSTAGSVRATSSLASSSLLYFEFQDGMSYSGGDSMIGFANVTHALGNWVGQDTNSIGYWWSNGGVYTNGGQLTTIFTSVPGDLIAVAVNTTANKVWFKNLTKGTGWNNDVIGNQNPVGPVGGIALTITGPYFPAWSSNNAGDYGLANFGATSFVGTLPSGYSAVGSGVTWNPADLLNVSLTPPIGLVSNTTTESWSAWQGLGYDANGLNVDPKFVTPGTDFHIQSTSPAKAAGFTISTVPQDKDGFPRASPYDIGAYTAPFP